MILLHTPSGNESWFNSTEIMNVHVADKLIWGKKANSVILIHDKFLAVSETVDEVIKKIKE